MSDHKHAPIRKNIKVLVVNVNQPGYDSDQIQSVIGKSEKIIGWLNHLPGIWFIETQLTASELAKLVYETVVHVNCFVTSIEGSTFSGRMSWETWLWLLDVSEETKAKFRSQMLQEQDAKRLEAGGN